MKNEEVAEKKRRPDVSSSSISLDIASTGKKSMSQSLLMSSHKSSPQFCPDHPKQIAMTNQIAKLICMDLQPYVIVEDPGFRALLQIAEPRYVIRLRKTLAEVTIPNLYENRVATVKSDVSDAYSLAITTDAWTLDIKIIPELHQQHCTFSDTRICVKKTYCLNV